MEIKRIVPSGYCKGVVNAINIVKETRDKYPNENIYVLGMIVHNTFVTKQLDELGIITLDDSNKTKEELLDEINNGVVIFTAHGTADNIKQKAQNKGLICVDAACVDVLKNKEVVKEYLKQGYDVLYFGKKRHPEAEAILSLSNKIHLITNINDINILNVNNDKLVITNQTTMSYLELKEMFEKAKEKYPNIVIEKEICNATSSRQKAVSEIKDGEVLYVVGDTRSNNTAKLATIGKQNFKKVFLINNKNEINTADLNGVSKVYVTAGASTPPILINEVIDYLTTF